MFSVFGETGHEYIDPYLYLSVYLYRRRFKSVPSSTNAFIFKSGNLFKYNDLQKKIIDIYDKTIYDALLNGKINIHGLRIGLNVSMEERGFTQGQITDYIGWALQKHQSSQIIYSRLSLYWKVNVIKAILKQDVKIGDLILKETLGKK